MLQGASHDMQEEIPRILRNKNSFRLRLTIADQNILAMSLLNYQFELHEGGICESLLFNIAAISFFLIYTLKAKLYPSNERGLAIASLATLFGMFLYLSLSCRLT